MRIKDKIKIMGITNAWEESWSVCQEFRKQFRNASYDDKIRRLLELSNYKIRDVNKTPETLKKLYNIKRARKHRPTKKVCWVCSGLGTVCQHHVILLSNGGHDTIWNRINICKCCHSKIHNWL